MKLLNDAPEARADRPATMILHDSKDARVVAFHLAEGQKVPSHSSESTVLVVVVSGRGRFHGRDGSTLLEAGQSAVYDPGEPHAIDAEGALRFLAVITPRPGG